MYHQDRTFLLLVVSMSMQLLFPHIDLPYVHRYLAIFFIFIFWASTIDDSVHFMLSRKGVEYTHTHTHIASHRTSPTILDHDGGQLETRLERLESLELEGTDGDGVFHSTASASLSPNPHPILSLDHRPHTWLKLFTRSILSSLVSIAHSSVHFQVAFSLSLPPESQVHQSPPAHTPIGKTHSQFPYFLLFFYHSTLTNTPTIRYSSPLLAIINHHHDTVPTASSQGIVATSPRRPHHTLHTHS